MALSLDGVLTGRALERLAGDTSFARALEYLDRVRNLRVSQGRATATVVGTQPYSAELTWSPHDGVAAQCSCPYAQQGHVCKHAVALGLAALDAAESGRLDLSVDCTDPVSVYLASLGRDELANLVTALSSNHPAVQRDLEQRTALWAGAGQQLGAELLESCRQVIASAHDVDYWEVPTVAEPARDLLEQLQTVLDHGSPDVAAPALLELTTGLRGVLEHLDDSDGELGGCCQEALDLYAHACREGHPDQSALGRWLATFRHESPGWPDAALPQFADALGEEGLVAYRAAVADLDAAHPATSETASRSTRFEIDRMLLELADHAGDVDAAIELLGRGDTPRVAAIIERLLAAGRDEEALRRLDEAIEAKRYSVRFWDHRNDVWLAPDRIVEVYVGADRPAHALSFARGAFHDHPGTAMWDVLMSLADRLGMRDIVREQELAWVQEQPWSTGTTPVALALHDNDVERAWHYADRWGAGNLWRELADVTPQPRPRAALNLYAAALGTALQFTGRDEAKVVASILSRMHALAGVADAQGDGEGNVESVKARVADIRVQYKRRPTLMSALRSARL